MEAGYHTPLVWQILSSMKAPKSRFRVKVLKNLVVASDSSHSFQSAILVS